jgi:hypothetical protein
LAKASLAESEATVIAKAATVAVRIDFMVFSNPILAINRRPMAATSRDSIVDPL